MMATRATPELIAALNDDIKPRLAMLNRLAQEDRLLNLYNMYSWRNLKACVDGILAQLRKQTAQTEPPELGERTRIE